MLTMLLLHILTGERGDVKDQYVTTIITDPLYGFKNTKGTTFMLNGDYNDNRLFYDGHPGYDYSQAFTWSRHMRLARRCPCRV
jgi:hypothetical protein